LPTGHLFFNLFLIGPSLLYHLLLRRVQRRQKLGTVRITWRRGNGTPGRYTSRGGQQLTGEQEEADEADNS
jgi:hypothetical protein